MSTHNVDLDNRVEFLAGLSIFSGIPRNLLVPLASNIDVRKYTLGEYVLRAGEEPDGLYVIKQGECMSLLEKEEKRHFTN